MMTRRTRKMSGSRTLKRLLTSMIRATGKLVMKQAAAPKAAVRRPRPSAPSKPGWHTAVALTVTGARRYFLFEPPNLKRSEQLPLMVMLHGCEQDATAFAASSKMNRLAARKRFFVLYPQQERLANLQGCWQWYATRAGKAQREADSIAATVGHVCTLHAVDRQRMAIAGLSAGASMAALVVTRHPDCFKALAMHSGIGPGVAHSSASAFMAMRGSKAMALPPQLGAALPALLVIHGSADHIVVPSNGLAVARHWAASLDAVAGAARVVQRGSRFAMAVTDYRAKTGLAVTHCLVNGLGHAWSGGAPKQAYSDPRGPDASSMIWTFAEKQFPK